MAELVDGVPDARLSSSAPHPLWVDRPRAGHAAWYELFPRSFGGLKGAIEHLGYVADLGFDVVYLPPIHPIGTTHRKGRGNSLVAGPDDPGSPWAIGGRRGRSRRGRTPSSAPSTDFDAFVDARRGPRPRGGARLRAPVQPGPPLGAATTPSGSSSGPTARSATPRTRRRSTRTSTRSSSGRPTTPDRVALWEACRDVLEHWIGHGVRTFRVDNPHTKPLAFWEWVIRDVQRRHPEVLFLAEAFTAPAMMAKLAEVGFTPELHVLHLAPRAVGAARVRHRAHQPAAGRVHAARRSGPTRPTSSTTTSATRPPSAFALRFVLAATLVPLYGIYSGYELCENEPADDTTTEYRHSEKYEIKARDYKQEPSLAPLIRTVNEIRRKHPTVWSLRDVRFHHSDNEQLLAYTPRPRRRRPAARASSTSIRTTRRRPGCDSTSAPSASRRARYHLHDELTGDRYTWEGDAGYVRLDPTTGQVAHLFHVTV